jgi:hypothetical protein
MLLQPLSRWYIRIGVVDLMLSFGTFCSEIRTLGNLGSVFHSARFFWVCERKTGGRFGFLTVVVLLGRLARRFEVLADTIFWRTNGLSWNSQI